MTGLLSPQAIADLVTSSGLGTASVPPPHRELDPFAGPSEDEGHPDGSESSIEAEERNTSTLAGTSTASMARHSQFQVLLVFTHHSIDCTDADAFYCTSGQCIDT